MWLLIDLLVALLPLLVLGGAAVTLWGRAMSLKRNIRYTLDRVPAFPAAPAARR